MKCLLFLCLVSLNVFADLPSPARPSEIVTRAEAQIGRPLTSAELELAKMVDEESRLRAETAQLGPGGAVPLERNVFVCVGLNIGVGGSWRRLGCKSLRDSRTATLSGTDWIGFIADGSVGFVVVDGPGVGDPSNYRGTYVRPIGAGGAFILGFGAITYGGKRRTIPVAETFTTTASPIDGSFSLTIYGVYAGVGGHLDLGSGRIVLD